MNFPGPPVWLCPGPAARRRILAPSDSSYIWHSHFFSQITIEKLIQILLHGTYKALEASSFFWSLKNFYGFLRSYMGPKSNLHPDTEISSMVFLTAKSSILRYIIWWYTVTAHCSNPLAKIFLAHNVLAEIRFESCPFLPPLFRKLWDTR